MKIRTRDGGYFEFGWADIVGFVCLAGLIVSLGALAWAGVENEIAKARGQELTDTVTPISWDYQDARTGNVALVALSPAFLPLAVGSPEMCWAEFELEDKTREESVSPELCTTRPATLQVTYWKYAYGINILEVTE